MTTKTNILYNYTIPPIGLLQVGVFTCATLYATYAMYMGG